MTKHVQRLNSLQTQSPLVRLQWSDRRRRELHYNITDTCTFVCVCARQRESGKVESRSFLHRQIKQKGRGLVREKQNVEAHDPSWEKRGNAEQGRFGGRMQGGGSRGLRRARAVVCEGKCVSAVELGFTLPTSHAFPPVTKGKYIHTQKCPVIQWASGRAGCSSDVQCVQPRFVPASVSEDSSA